MTISVEENLGLLTITGDSTDSILTITDSAETVNAVGAGVTQINPTTVTVPVASLILPITIDLGDGANETVDASGVSHKIVYVGGTGIDTVTGGSCIDKIAGGAVNDVLDVGDV